MNLRLNPASRIEISNHRGHGREGETRMEATMDAACSPRTVARQTPHPESAIAGIRLAEPRTVHNRDHQPSRSPAGAEGRMGPAWSCCRLCRNGPFPLRGARAGAEAPVCASNGFKRRFSRPGRGLIRRMRRISHYDAESLHNYPGGAPDPGCKSLILSPDLCTKLFGVGCYAALGPSIYS